MPPTSVLMIRCLTAMRRRVSRASVSTRMARSTWFMKMAHAKQPIAFRLPMWPARTIWRRWAVRVYTTTNESGDVQVGFPGENGMGLMVSGAVEGSNVDLAEELTNMIVAQRSLLRQLQGLSDWLRSAERGCQPHAIGPVSRGLQGISPKKSSQHCSLVLFLRLSVMSLSVALQVAQSALSTRQKGNGNPFPQHHQCQPGRLYAQDRACFHPVRQRWFRRWHLCQLDWPGDRSGSLQKPSQRHIHRREERSLSGWVDQSVRNDW